MRDTPIVTSNRTAAWTFAARSIALVACVGLAYGCGGEATDGARDRAAASNSIDDADDGPAGHTTYGARVDGCKPWADEPVPRRWGSRLRARGGVRCIVGSPAVEVRVCLQRYASSRWKNVKCARKRMGRDGSVAAAVTVTCRSGRFRTRTRYYRNDVLSGRAVSGAVNSPCLKL